MNNLDNIFVKMGIYIHGNKYDYSEVEDYNDTKQKMKIKCPVHGPFYQDWNHHIIRKQGCRKCAAGSLSIEDYIKKFNIIHNNFYDYSLIKEINSVHQKIEIICPDHGIFIQKVVNHLKGNRCKDCFLDSRRLKKDEFIKKSKVIHHYHNYDYSKVEYKNHMTGVEIICGKHGPFWQTPNNHLAGNGCPICKDSKGERIVSWFLKKYEIKFTRQQKFKDCKYLDVLPFDFYLPDYNYCIEYDGEQHFKPLDFFGGIKEYEIIKIKDKIKTDYCKNKNISLLRINYKENIIIKLRKFLEI